jgi:isoquinoline 1-oxidoreductase subunit beta
MGANEFTRREFLKVTAAAGGFALSAGWTQVFAQDKYGPDSMPHGAVDNPLVFVSIAANGIVTITCHRAEMGQGVRTGMPMIIADELEADWSKVRVAQAPGDELRYCNQDTDGSRTTRHFFMPMRRCGASA